MMRVDGAWKPRINPGETIVLVHFRPCALFCILDTMEIFFGSRETMWSIKLLWRPSKRSPAAGDNFGRLVSTQQLFVLLVSIQQFTTTRSHGVLLASWT
jgi:hypothetical protein